jgi:hypothetical protein
MQQFICGFTMNRVIAQDGEMPEGVGQHGLSHPHRPRDEHMVMPLQKAEGP